MTTEPKPQPLSEIDLDAYRAMVQLESGYNLHHRLLATIDALTERAERAERERDCWALTAEILTTHAWHTGYFRYEDEGYFYNPEKIDLIALAYAMAEAESEAENG